MISTKTIIKKAKNKSKLKFTCFRCPPIINHKKSLDVIKVVKVYTKCKYRMAVSTCLFIIMFRFDLCNVCSMHYSIHEHSQQKYEKSLVKNFNHLPKVSFWLYYSYEWHEMSSFC